MWIAWTLFFCRKFLHVRVAKDGRALDARCGRPYPTTDGWFRIAWLPLGGYGEERKPETEGWQRAWHGTNLEALCCIAYFGRLMESNVEARGERFLHGPPGVYLHKDAHNAKSEHCCRCVKLAPDGLF